MRDGPLGGQGSGNGHAPRRISVLGATGSIGQNTLDLVERNPGAYEVVALTGHRNVTKLAELAMRHKAKLAVTADPAAYHALRELLAGSGVEAAAGDEAVVEAAARPADWIMASIVGSAGLRPTFTAIRQGTHVALANKECLVTAGRVFMTEVERSGAVLLPVDSEHSAAFQAIAGSPRSAVERIILTASGGPFRSWPGERLATARPAEALKHPNWSMGAKVTIDSATLMNKGLELIEAQLLFDMPPERLEVVVHPQSIVHALVEYKDGSVLAQMGNPDMRTPIACSLAWPDRMDAPTKRLDLVAIAALTFEAPDQVRFPALGIARAAMERGGSAPAILNAANEIAVAAYLEERIGFLDIAALVGEALEAAERDGLTGDCSSLEEVLDRDLEARSRAYRLLEHYA